MDHLKGKEITSAGHLSAQNFSFGEEIIELDGKLNFYLQADFDVDAAFGTFVCTDQNDDWLNIYATDIDEGAYERLRGKAIRDMKRTNGRISFKDALDFQKSV